MKKALKIALWGFLFSVLFCNFSATAQRLYFCQSVSESGDPVGLNQFFYIPQNGATNIAMLIKLPFPADADSVELRFFGMDSLNNEIYLSSVLINVEKDWTWFWKSIEFKYPGRFKTYVFADRKRLLCSETVDAYVKQ